MLTIYDIAKVAGVSPATVSKVFNNYSDVSIKTRDRITKIADEMGYVPNLSARSLKTNRSYLIGIIFSENMGIGLEHQFFSVVLESFRKAIGKYGYDSIFINKSIGNKDVGYLDHCKYRNVDGIFIITAREGELDFAKIVESDIHCVTTDIIFNNTPYVMSDNFDGAKLAVQYLYDRGHKKIAHLSGPADTISTTDRNAGYKEALSELELNKSKNLLFFSDSYSYDDAYEASLTFFKTLPIEKRPTAIFAGSDIMAIALIKALETFNLKVPEDISIIGFDDIELSKYSNPPLTTIRQDKIRIGAQLAQTLIERIDHPDTPITSHKIPVSIVERKTVRRI